MRLATTELINLSNLLLNDLEHSRWVVLEAFSRKDEMDVNDDFVTKMAAITMSLAIAKANMLNKLVGKSGMPRPSDEGIELIEFWLDVNKVAREDEANDT